MLTALSNGVRLPAKMRDLGISGKTACAIVGIPASRLNLCTTGIQDLSPDDARKLHDLCHRLAAIQTAVPFPLSFANADKWSAILEHLERENIDIAALGRAVDKIFNARQ